ncbi:MAG TPA: SDR family oxidoreductase [Pseudolabrys sp.]|nr:SDR family oxidoreductase [Pseudolabrys sp.]
MRNKSILVTGASSGIGAALSSAFAHDGHRVFICARRRDKLAEVAAQSRNVSYFECDVGVDADVRHLFEQIGAAVPSLDVVVHCAAISGPVGLTPDVDGGAWLTALQTNVFGAFLVVKHAIPLMRSDARPRVILLSGGGAFDPMPNLSAYGVSKAAIVRFAETLAVELAPRNIAVNVLAPGFVATEIFDSIVAAGPERGGALYDTVLKLLKEWKSDDLQVPIDCARFLISEKAHLLTGKTISARHDPWDRPEFLARLPEIVSSKLFTTQRVSGVQAEDEALAEIGSSIIGRSNP